MRLELIFALIQTFLSKRTKVPMKTKLTLASLLLKSQVTKRTAVKLAIAEKYSEQKQKLISLFLL